MVSCKLRTNLGAFYWDLMAVIAMFLRSSHRQVPLHMAPPASICSSHLPQIQGENHAAQSAQYRGVLGTILTMVRTEGARSPYNGLIAGLQRQMSFASIRIGLYDSVKQFYTPKGSDCECLESQGHQGGG